MRTVLLIVMIVVVFIAVLPWIGVLVGSYFGWVWRNFCEPRD